jgi:hypothetical protein
MSESSMESILDEETPAEQAEVQAEQPTEQPAQSRDESGKFAAKEAAVEPEKVEPKPEKEAITPAQEASAKERAYYAAAMDERSKRQALEKRIAELEGQTKKEPAKGFWDDPEETLNKFKGEMLGLVQKTRLETSEHIARTKYQDFDKSIEVFGQVLQATPGLKEQWLQSGDPAEFAYRIGKNYSDIKDAGNVESLRAKIQKEEREKIEAEIKEKSEKSRQERESIPGSLTDARGHSSRPVFTGPTSMDNILGD